MNEALGEKPVLVEIADDGGRITFVASRLYTYVDGDGNANAVATFASEVNTSASGKKKAFIGGHRNFPLSNLKREDLYWITKTRSGTVSFSTPFAGFDAKETAQLLAYERSKPLRDAAKASVESLFGRPGVELIA